MALRRRTIWRPLRQAIVVPERIGGRGMARGILRALFFCFLECVVLKFGVEIPFVSHLGFTLHRMEGGESELRYEAKPEHLNSLT